MAKESQFSQNGRTEMLKAFDETKAGVKGLTDSGLLKVPQIFIRPSEELAQEHFSSTKPKTQIQVPVIDLSGIQHPERRKQIVEEIRLASETWGFFQVVNHGIPESVLDGMIQGIRKFNEDDAEKEQYYSRDLLKATRFESSYDLFTAKTASWRDSLSMSFPGEPNQINPQELPPSCRDSTLKYSKHVKILGNILFGLLSEGLGLKTNELEEMGCSNGHRFACHYYPACPQPELVIGTTKHSDAGFLTILLQNNVNCGLQVLFQGQWIDILPTPGALVVNIADLLQLVSNGKLKSNEHRAIANRSGPRISVACFFAGPVNSATAKLYGPIKHLISEENPQMYKDVVLGEYVARFYASALGSFRAIDCYKI